MTDDLERQRVERLARELVPIFEQVGQAVELAEDLDDVDRWRSACRRAGRILGRSVRTGIAPAGVVWAAVSDEHPQRTAGQLRGAGPPSDLR